MTTEQSLQILWRELHDQGLTRKAPGRVLLELAIHLAFVSAGVAVYFGFHGLVLRVCGLVLVTAGSIGVGTNTHTSSHYATSHRRLVNEVLTYFGYPFFLGLSATHWWQQHVVVHHPSPNVVGLDDDADLSPWLARTAEEVARSRGVKRFYYQHLQWLLLPALLALNGFNMQKSGWLQLIHKLRDSRARTRKHWIDLGALILHYICLLVVPALLYGFRPIITLYVLRLIAMGYAMFAVLAPGHFPVEAVCFQKDGPQPDYLHLQTAATVNFRPGPIGALICSGLQYQIEHHLFPNLCHVQYPKVSVPVRDFCRRHGLPYRCFSWDAVLWKCVRMLMHPPPTQLPAIQHAAQATAEVG